MSELVLSLFPGIGLRQSELFGRCDSTMEHGVVVWTQYPHVFCLCIPDAPRRSIPRPLVVKIDHKRFAAHGAGARYFWVSQQKAIYPMACGGIFLAMIFLPCFRVAGVKSFDRSFASYLRAFVRTVFAPPIPSIFSRKGFFANGASPLFGRWLTAMQSLVAFSCSRPRLTLLGAVFLIASLRHECLAALNALARLLLCNGIIVRQPLVMSSTEATPIMGRVNISAHSKPATAFA